MANQLFHQTGSNKVSYILCIGIQVNVNEKREESEYPLNNCLLLCLGCIATQDIAMVIKGKNTAQRYQGGSSCKDLGQSIKKLLPFLIEQSNCHQFGKPSNLQKNIIIINGYTLSKQYWLWQSHKHININRHEYRCLECRSKWVDFKAKAQTNIYYTHTFLESPTMPHEYKRAFELQTKLNFKLHVTFHYKFGQSGIMTNIHRFPKTYSQISIRLVPI